MSITKVSTISSLYKIPLMKCRISKKDKNLIVADDMQFYVLSERYDLRKASYKKLEKEGWRVPLEITLKFSEDLHRGFKGIHNKKLIKILQDTQVSLGENFNELVYSIIHNKTAFYTNVIKELGYKFIWQPIDGQEIIKNGFRIYRCQ